MSKICMIFGAAPGMDAAPVSLHASPEASLILCADGGAVLCGRVGLTPHLIIGDGDSLPSGIEVTGMKLPFEKDVTDLHACVDYGLAQGCGEFLFYGCTGGRLDHFLSAVGLLEYVLEQGASGAVIDADNKITLHPGGTEILRPPHEWTYFSVIPLDKAVYGVYLSNVKYPLTDAVLFRAGSLGVSNEPLEGKNAEITISRGRALIIQSGRKKP